ncbi:MAG: hypothetical protein ACXWC7_07270 [Chitinophagaceae bacterium]
MKRTCLFTILILSLQLFTGCNDENSSDNSNGGTGNKVSGQNFVEGKDYVVFERVRLMDKTGFSEPQEAYSMLLPKGWQHEDEIIWKAPGAACEGTYRQLKAQSSDGKHRFQMYPDVIYSWNTNPELQQFYNDNENSYCARKKPMSAEQYLRDIFISEELKGASVVKVESNPYVVEQMQQNNESAMNELRQYGAGQMRFDQSAVNATVSWSDGREGIVVLGVSTLETMVPNVYNGSYETIYTTQVTKRIVFSYPKEEKELAENQFSILMGGFRTNPAWNDAVNRFWKDVRQQKQVAHIGRIRMMDEQTRQMGEAAIRRGEQRLKDMDTEMRSWEQKQASQDRMHTNFIKTIREVENYQDASGKFELSSGYNHAWSREDGSNFILSNNPNFDPGSVFRDQKWKEMKKVD